MNADKIPNYTQDTSDKINFDRLARVVAGLEKVISDLAMVEID